MKLNRSVVAGRCLNQSSGGSAESWLRNATRPLPASVGSLEQDSPGPTAGFFLSHFLVTTILVVTAATVAIVPMLVLGTVSGRDFPFHLASWMDVARQWRHGTIYPQWAELANWGFGEPRFVFYPPGSWMIGAALGSLFPWKAVPTLFNWLVLVGAGLSMHLLARQVLSPRQAALAAIFFAANPYHLLLIYFRSDFAELLASAFFPLLPWGVMRIARDRWRAVPLLSLLVALIWLSNAPAAVIALYSVAFLFIVAYGAARDLRLLLYGSVAIAGGLGLAAFYILPAAHQRAWVQINQVLSDGLRPEQNFLFSRADGMAVNTDFNLKISCVVLLMAMVMLAAAIHFAKSSELPALPYWLLVALGAMSLFMMFRVSAPLWRIAPELHFVQFPWRYAVPLAVVFSFFLGAAAGKLRYVEIAAICLLVLAGPMGKIWLAKERPSSWDKAEITQFQRNFDGEIGYRGTPEYLPNGANDKALPTTWGNPGMGDGSPLIPETIRVQTTSPERIVLNVFDYPAWHVDVDGTAIAKQTDKDGRIVVPMTAGNHILHLSLRRDWDAKLGLGIALATGVFLSCLILFPSTRVGPLGRSKAS
jgi:hypothetical protein